MLRDIFPPHSPTLDAITRSLCYPTCLFVLILALAEGGQNIMHTPGKQVVSCTEFALQENALFVFFLATTNRHTLKNSQGSGGSLLSILSEGNVCYRGLDFLQVSCIPKAQISLCVVTCSVSTSRRKSKWLSNRVLLQYSNKVNGICLKMSVRLCINPSIQI